MSALKAVREEASRKPVEQYTDILNRLRSSRPIDTAAMNSRNDFNAELIKLAQSVIRREVEFERLFELIDTVQRGVTPEDVLGRVYDSFSDLIPYDRIGCAFLSPDGRTLTAHWARSALGSVRLGRGFCQAMTVSRGSSTISKATFATSRVRTRRAASSRRAVARA
jgi:hypothetical protein